MRLFLGAVYYVAILPAIVILAVIDYVVRSFALKNNPITRWVDATEHEAFSSASIRLLTADDK